MAIPTVDIRAKEVPDTETSASSSRSEAQASEVRTVVYADCKAALEAAWRRGLPRAARIRTLAPAILADDTIDSEPGDDRLTTEDIVAIKDSLHAAASEVHGKLRSVDAREHPEMLPLVAARAIMVELQNYIFPAAMLREEDYIRPPTVVVVRHPTAALRRRFLFAVARLLGDGAEPRLLEMPAADLPPVDEPSPPTPPLRVRLANATASAISFRLGCALWERLPFSGPRGCLLVLGSNELLRETAARLLGRGFALRRLTPPKATVAGVGQAGDADIESVVRAAIVGHLKRFFPAAVVAALAQIGVETVAAFTARFAASRARWRKVLARHARHKPRAVLTSGAWTPEEAALHSELRGMGLPLVTFQHGVTAEIAAWLSDSGLLLDNAACDLALTFNEAMAALCDANPFGRGKAVAVGMPDDYRRLARRRPITGHRPIWYVRTTLYQSNLGRLHRGLSDPAMYAFESALINQVFARLPHAVTYKPYPAIRYLDPDPALALAACQPNIDVYEDRQDLRYVVGAARVLVTAGATSTVSWCLMSGKPTVFIDNPEFMPLRPEVREVFGAGLFLFDGGAADFHDRLRAFLSQPIEAIDALWRARAAARKRLIRSCISVEGADAGAAGADAVMTMLAAHGRARHDGLT